ncbi:hypothetical protein D9M68_1007080 [compost metagenome]
MGLEAFVEFEQIVQAVVGGANGVVAQSCEKGRFVGVLIKDLGNCDGHCQSIRVQLLPSKAMMSLPPMDHSTPSAALRW